MYNTETINARNWDLLLYAIEKKRVVPIIGNEYFYVEDKNSRTSMSIENISVEQKKWQRDRSLTSHHRRMKE